MNLTQPETYLPHNFKLPAPAVVVEANCVTGEYVERSWASKVHDGCEDFRNAIVIAHRRAGKTVCIVAQLIRDAFACDLIRPQVAYIAPTAKQARDVAWQYFVQLLAEVPGVKYRRHELTIELPERLMSNGKSNQGGRILFASGENYDRLRGMYLDSCAVDEMADCPEALIPMVLRPALSDRKGSLYLIGTVRGMNHLWTTYQQALDSPDWYAGKFLPDDTDTIDADELAFLRREMSEDAYKQEMLCDPTAASRGSYYGQVLSDHDDQQCNVPYDQALPVTVGFDLGIADSTAIWFAQLHRGGEIRLFDYVEYQNTGFLQILRELREKEFKIDRWIGPHDLKVREYSSGQSRIDAAAEVGVDFDVAPRLPVIDGIEAVRRAMPRMYFDRVKCKQGLICLQQYRSEYDEKKRVLSRNPVHDWTSHAADAMRYLITGTDGGQQRMLWEPPVFQLQTIDNTGRYRRGAKAAS